MKLLGIFMNFKRHRFFVYGVNVAVVTIVMCGVSCVPIFLYLNGLQHKIQFFDSSLLLFLNTAQFFYVVQFELACLALRVRFVALINYLSDSKLKTKCRIFAANFAANNKFCRSYLTLCDAIEIVNEFFTFPFVFIFGFMLVSKYFDIEANLINRIHSC